MASTSLVPDRLPDECSSLFCHENSRARVYRTSKLEYFVQFGCFKAIGVVSSDGLLFDLTLPFLFYFLFALFWILRAKLSR